MALPPREEIDRAFETIESDPKAAVAMLLEVYAHAAPRSVHALAALDVLRIAAAAAGDAATELMAAVDYAEHAPTAENLLWVSRVLHQQQLWDRAVQAYQRARDALRDHEKAQWEPIIRANLALCEQKLLPKFAEAGQPLTLEDKFLFLAEWLIDQGRTDEARVVLVDGLAELSSSDRIRQALADLEAKP